jgi:hypothetical protein
MGLAQFRIVETFDAFRRRRLLALMINGKVGW